MDGNLNTSGNYCSPIVARECRKKTETDSSSYVHILLCCVPCRPFIIHFHKLLHSSHVKRNKLCFKPKFPLIFIPKLTEIIFSVLNWFQRRRWTEIFENNPWFLWAICALTQRYNLWCTASSNLSFFTPDSMYFLKIIVPYWTRYLYINNEHSTFRRYIIISGFRQHSPLSA